MDGEARPLTTLYLVRHAHADWQPSDARPLSATGRASAQAIAEQFAESRIAAIYSSPSTRAVQTIEPLADRLGIQPVIVEDLRERELSAPSAPDFEAAVEATWRQPDIPFGNGESNTAAQARGVAVVRGVLERHGHQEVMLSTHGSLLVLMVNAFDARYGYEFWRTMTFPDAYRLEFRGNRLIEVRRVWDLTA